MTSGLTVEKTFDERILSAVKKMIEEQGISQKDLAKNIGYSTAAINTYLNGKYQGNTEEFESNLKQYLNLANKKKAHKKVRLQFEKTSIAQRFFNIANMCQLNSEIGLCFGPSGIGKSTAIQEYAKQNSGVLIVDTNEFMSMRDMVGQLCDCLKIRIPPTGYYTHNNIIASIEKKLINSGCLVVVDEAENLDPSLFRVLRKMHDRCNFSFGLLFVGTHQLHSNITRMRTKFEYVVNRISIIEAFDTLTRGDVKALVNQIFGDCEDNVINTFCQKSNQNARILFSLMKRTNDILKSSGEELNINIIQSASKWLLV